ncbi:BatD family protein, partial [bacterium]|nr:BatD family protein [bacterium]
MRKTGNMPARLILRALLLAVFVGASFAQATISVSLDAKKVLIQESFTWKIEVEGSDEMPVVRLPNIEKVALLSGPMQSSNYSYVNGKMSSKKTVSYTFVALEQGNVTIPSVEVFIGNKSYHTKALKLEIVSSRTGSSRSGSQGQIVFLRAIPSKTSVYVGEPLSVQYKLFTKVGVYNYQVDKLPNAVGFWAEEVPQKVQPRLVSEIIDGVRY